MGGEAGYGITTIGQMFARACSRAGLNVFGYAEYPSLIRGGHNTAQVRVGAEPVRAHSDKIDLLVALNKETIDLHLNEMVDGAVIIYDGEAISLEGIAVPAGVEMASVPLNRIVKELEAEKVMRNTVALAASAAIAGLEFAYIQSVIESTFARKGKGVVDFNVNVAKAGYDYAIENLKLNFAKKLPAHNGGEAKQIVVSGNDAIALAAIKAGVKFMAAYPMTPVTSIMQIIAKHGAKYNIVMKQTEDEIAAVNMAIGAAHMGVRSMTATSGGGFSLMTEALGMAAITETPLVLIEGTRPGPSTGLPTWTDQSDLYFVLHASQGEFPLVLALPGDIQESFDMTLKAFNLADKYQMLCIIMTDKYLGESIRNITPFDSSGYKVDRGELLTMEQAAAIKPGEYKRFKFTENGVSPRALSGYPNCIYTASTDEHQEDGDLHEGSENRVAMMDKRAKKLLTLTKESLPESEMFEVHGDPNADLTVVGWGSTKGPILDALSIAKENGWNVNFLQIKYASPFPSEGVKNVLSAVKAVLLVENNSKAQMGSLIREKTGFEIPAKLLRYDGRPINPMEIVAKIAEMFNTNNS